MLLLVDVQPYLATDYTLLAFVIVILGGLGSMPGALLGGVLVGVSEALSGFFVEPSLKSAVQLRAAHPGAAGPAAGVAGARDMSRTDAAAPRRRHRCAGHLRRG